MSTPFTASPQRLQLLQPPPVSYGLSGPSQAAASSTTVSGKGWQPDPALLQTRALQARFPGLKAQLAQPLPFDQVVSNTRTTLSTLNQVWTHNPVKDYQLGILDDQSKRLGSLLIAGLATWGLKQRIFGVGEFLGFLSWYFAMAATPKIVNALVQLKTGVNLNRQYYSSEGQRQDLYKDPNYLPLHLLPDYEINRVANNLGIPADAPDRRKQVEDRIRRISVQGHTWWMLMAGPATPVISGLICDQLQDPATRLVNRIKTAWAKRGIAGAEGDALARKAEAVLTQQLGEVPESDLSMWWKNFGAGMVQHTGLGKKLGIQEVIHSPSELLLSKISDYFATLKPDSTEMKEVLKFLNRQSEALSQMKGQANDFLEPLKDKLDEKIFNSRREWIESRMITAEMSIQHYRRLLEAVAEGTANRETVRKHLEEPLISVVQRLLDDGRETDARKLVGNPETFKRIRTVLGNGQFGPAFRLMGASPEAHLLTGLKDTMLRKLWQRRVLGYGSGGLLLATLLYTVFAVGHPFKDKPKGARRP